MREWKDVIAKAPTGTGKTFAFGIPIIEQIEPGSEETEAVILAPTRELAMQITAELRDLCVYLPGVRIVVPVRRRAHRQADRRAQKAPADRRRDAGPPERPHEAPHRQARQRQERVLDEADACSTWASSTM